MSVTRMFAALGRFAYRRRWWVIAGWVVLAASGVLAGGQTLDRLTTVDSLSPSAESSRADARIKQLTSDGPIVFAVIGDVELYAPAVVASVSQVSAELRKLPGVVEVRDLYTGPGGAIGADNRSTLVQVELDESLSGDHLEAVEDEVTRRLHTIEAPSVLVGGDHLAERAFGDQAGRDLAVGETVAFIALLVALLIVFGGVVAAGLPLAVAVASVSVTLLVLLGLSFVTDVGDYSLNIVTLLGLGLAVDYALLIVARYREELAGGADPAAAAQTAVTRAGWAVAISGMAVAVSLAALAAFAEPLLGSMALGGAAVVVLTTLLALTLVPALLAVAGARIPPAGAQTWVTRLVDRTSAQLSRRGPENRVPKGRVPKARGRNQGPPASLLVRLATLAQRRPALVALAATVGMFVLAAPVAFASFANSDARSLPASVQERQAYQAYQRLFAQADAPAVTVVASVDAGSVDARDFLNALNRIASVSRLDIRPDVPAGTMIIDLTPKDAADGASLVREVRGVRADRQSVKTLVTGEAAKVADYQASVGQRLPYAIALVVLVMMILLFALTRSVVVPVKAVLLAALTFVATLGILVAIFQWGWGELILRFESWGALDLTTPLLLFVFIFGLSMDYEVFLLARIREEYDTAPRRAATGVSANDRAVLAGIGRSGPVVTAAAVCITIVFLGFAVGGLIPLKEIGVGMAVAVALDVTVVRGLLLPAVMSLLGDLNWWSPLRRRA